LKARQLQYAYAIETQLHGGLAYAKGTIDAKLNDTPRIEPAATAERLTRARNPEPICCTAGLSTDASLDHLMGEGKQRRQHFDLSSGRAVCMVRARSSAPAGAAIVIVSVVPAFRRARDRLR